MEKASHLIELVSGYLDKIRFTCMDQNPHGLRDTLFCQIRKVRLLEEEVEELREFKSKFSSSMWPCESSLNKGNNCVYAGNDEDCVFCYQPSERK